LRDLLSDDREALRLANGEIESMEQPYTTLSERRDLPDDKVIALYSANGWSAAKKPQELLSALRNSHSLVSAWIGEQLVGLGNSLSDGYLVVYYPHLLVLPMYQGRGIGEG